MRCFIIVGKDRAPRGFAFASVQLARKCLPEADANWPSGAPHEVVAFVPEVAPSKASEVRA